MWRHILLSSVVLIIGISSANANLFLTIDGENPTGIPLMLSGTGPYTIVLDGNTPIGPNDVRFEVIAGTLTALPDVNHQYSFQYEGESTAGLIRLITNIDMTIDGFLAPAGMTIYELFVFCNHEHNFTGACGSDITVFIPPPEEEQGGEDESPIEEPAEPNGINKEEFSESQEITEAEETQDITMSGEIEERLMIESTNPEIPLYVQNCVERVRTFKQSGIGTGIIVINEVNESCILDNETIYYVPNPPLIIEGNDVRVYIPSDTIIVMEYAPDSDSIVVKNGASVIFGTSNGQADKTIILPPTWIVAVEDIPFQHNICGILIEQSASSESWINNIFINNSRTAIETRPLDYPVANIYADHCYKGIIYHGSGAIYNSQITNFGKITDGIFPYEGRGIEFIPTSIDGNQIYEGAQFDAYFNLVCNGDIGITAQGLDWAYSSPTLKPKSNATIKCSKYAYDTTLNIWIDYLYNCGFYDNAEDSNDPSLEWYFIDPVYEVNNPCVFLMGDYRAYLKDDSLFVDGGYEYAYNYDQPGWSPFVDGKPDSNFADIWIHHQTRKFTATADLTGDGTVDFLDIEELMQYWLSTESSSDIDGDGWVDIRDLEIITINWLEQGLNLGDLTSDNLINFMDFAMLCNQWGAKDPTYADLNGDRIVNFVDYSIVTGAEGQSLPSLRLINLNGEDVDKHDVNGLVYVDFNNFDASTPTVAVYIDNILLEKYIDEGWYPVELPSYIFSNGQHKIQLVSYDVNNNATVHKPVEVDFNNVIYYSDFSNHFHPTENFTITGFTDLNTLEVSVVAENNNVLWSQDFNNLAYIKAIIPGSVFTGQQICDVSITSDVSASSTKAETYKSFRQSDYPGTDPNYKMAIILPNPDIEKVQQTAIEACRQACRDKNIRWVELHYQDVNEENLIYVLNKDRMKFIKYVYWTGHTNSHADKDRKIQRTNFWIWKKDGRKFKKRNAYSYMDGLPSKYNEGLNLRSSWFGMSNSTLKKIVFIDGCYSALYDDMAITFGAYSYANCVYPANHDQIYIGWTNEPGHGILYDMLYMNFTGGVKLFWERMGSDDTLKEAFEYIQFYGSTPIKRAFWDGDDFTIDQDNCTPLKPLPPDPNCTGSNCCNDNIRWHGCGDIWSIKLTNTAP